MSAQGVATLDPSKSGTVSYFDPPLKKTNVAQLVEAATRPAELNSTPVLQPMPVVGPKSVGYMSDLSVLERAVRQDAPDADAQIQRFMDRHNIKSFLEALWRGSMYPYYVPSIGVAGFARENFRISGIHNTHLQMHEHHQRLSSLKGKIDSGEMSVSQAREEAARPVRTYIAGIFGGSTGMEIASLPEEKGMLVTFEKDGGMGVMTMQNARPDRYVTFRESWQDLSSAMVLDRNNAVVAVDPLAPNKGYESVMRLLRYVGEIGQGVRRDRRITMG